MLNFGKNNKIKQFQIYKLDNWFFRGSFNDIIDSIADLDADVISIETSRSAMELLDAFVEFQYPNEIGPGVYDIHSPRIPKVKEMENLLYKYRKGDSNRTSVWICSRNDAIANIAVIFAGLGVWITNTKWPDLAVAFIIASISLSVAYHIIKKAKKELEVRKVIN